MTPALIALGSNLGDRFDHMRVAITALAALPQTALRAVSDLYETAPVGGPENQGAFLNAVVRLDTRLPPTTLLAALHEIEASRQRLRQIRWGARTLDLDILIWGDRVQEAPSLTLPHPRMQERRFVMVPVCDIAADRTHPVLGRTMAEICAELPATHGDLTRIQAGPDWQRSANAEPTAAGRAGG